MSVVGDGIAHNLIPWVPEEVHWYAVQTRSRHEKVMAAQLREQGVSTFLHMITGTRRWSRTASANAGRLS